MATDRREFFKGLAVASIAAVPASQAVARERKTVRDDAVGLLYDATKCIGCKTCVVACREANKTKADTSTFGGGLYDAPDGLNESTKNVIALYKTDDEFSYVKKQCMHCVDPACVGACMLGALHKGKYGIVEYAADKCVGCRYCQMACPFNVPKFEWTKLNPQIIKCELCKERLAEGKITACAEVCPRGAVKFGKRNELLLEARARIQANPDKYVPKVYGENDLGGTQVLYVSHVPFEKLGFRFNSDEPVPEVQQTVQHGVYQGFAAPLALFAVLGAVVFRNRRAQQGEEEK